MKTIAFFTKAFAVAAAVVLATASCSSDDSSEVKPTPQPEAVSGTVIYCVPLTDTMLKGLDVNVSVTDASGKTTSLTATPDMLKKRSEVSGYFDPLDAADMIDAFKDMSSTDTDMNIDRYFVYTTTAKAGSKSTVSVTLSPKTVIDASCSNLDVMDATPYVAFTADAKGSTPSKYDRGLGVQRLFQAIPNNTASLTLLVNTLYASNNGKPLTYDVKISDNGKYVTSTVKK